MVQPQPIQQIQPQTQNKIVYVQGPPPSQPAPQPAPQPITAPSAVIATQPTQPKVVYVDAGQQVL